MAKEIQKLLSDISRHSLYSYNYWPLGVDEPIYDSPLITLEDIPVVSLWYYNYFPIREKEPVESGSIQNEYRIAVLESNPTVVLTTPYFDIESIAAGRTVRIDTKSESLLIPKRKITHYKVTCEELDIDKIWIAYQDGSVSIPVSMPEYANIGTWVEFRIQAFDDLGNKSRLVKSKIKITMGYVKTPEIINPEKGQIVYYDCSCGVRVKTSQFETDGLPDIHDFTDWKITSDELGHNKIEAEINSEELTEFTFLAPRMSRGRVYYIWARHHGKYLGYSDWGMVSVVGWNVEVKRPVIKTEKSNVLDLDGYSMWDYVNEPLEEDSSGLNKVNIRKENLIVKVGEFEVIGCEDKLFGTRWRLSKDLECQDVFYETLIEGTDNFCSFPILPEMSNREPFFVSCRFISYNYGESDWSLPVKYIPELGTILPPNIVKPEDGDLVILNDGVELEASEFLTQYYEDLYSGTEWKICGDITGNTVLVRKKVATLTCRLEYFDLRSLESDNIYYVFASHYGTELSPSDWSAPVAIQTYAGKIKTPEILTPEIGKLYTPKNDIEITSSEFETIYITDTHKSTDWKITEDKLGEYAVAESLDSTDLTSHNFTGLNLASGRKYYLWVRYNGESGEQSDWSESREIRVISGLTEVCSIIEPENNTSVIANMDSLTIKTSPYSCTGEADTFSKMQWKICDDLAGALPI